MDKIELRLATRSEEGDCLKLLPGIEQPDAELLIAKSGGTILGSAAIRWINWNTPRGLPLTISVTERARRKGVGSGLLRLASLLAQDDAEGFWAIRPFSPTSLQASFLQARGFSAIKSILTYKVDTARFFVMISGIKERMARSGRIPDAAITIPLGNVAFPAVMQLAAECLSQNPQSYESQFISQIGNGSVIDFDASVASLYNGVLVGATFGRWNDGECQIDANVVHRDFRKSSINVLQLYESTRRIKVRGSKTFTFRCSSDVTDSVNLAKRSGADLLGEQNLYYLPFHQRPSDVTDSRDGTPCTLKAPASCLIPTVASLDRGGDEISRRPSTADISYLE